MSELVDKKCTHQEGPALDPADAASLLEQLDGWHLCDDGKSIHRTFEFKNYYRTLAFVNAAAWIAHSQDHHPDMAVGYNRCGVRFSTHSAGGLSENDFISAAKIDRLLKP